MKLVAPQIVHSDKGFIVQVADRYTVEYIDSNSKWNIEVDFGLDSTGIYSSTLKIENGASAIEKGLVVERIVSALNLMGLKCELYD